MRKRKKEVFEGIYDWGGESKPFKYVNGRPVKPSKKIIREANRVRTQK